MARRTKFFGYLCVLTALVGAVAPTFACDLCGCYTPQIEAMPQTPDLSAFGLTPAAGEERGWLGHTYLAVAEQFTHFGTVQIDGSEVANPTGQYLDSSITQVVAGYSFNSRFALQINVPLIYRSFERPEGFAIDRGTESGLGDISILGKFVVFHKEIGGAEELKFDDPKNPHFETREPDLTTSILLMGGVKFPTGGTSRLKEEFNEVEVPGAPESGIHGHDLTLGSGSYDGVIGGQFALRYKSFFFQADTQFAARGDGAHQYDFANDLSWSGGPVITSCGTAARLLGCNAPALANTKGSTASKASRPRIPASLRSIWDRGSSLRLGKSAANWPWNYLSRSTTPRSRSSPIIASGRVWPYASNRALRSRGLTLRKLLR